MARVFVAVRLPAAPAAVVIRAQRELDRRLADVKWVEAENLHLTLRFFGELAAGEIERTVAAVTAVANATTAFPLCLEGLGTFPERGRPRVIWAGVTAGSAEVVALAARLEERFAASGLGRADRPFAPHLTVGRVHDPNARRRGREGRGRVPLQATVAMQEAIAAVPLERVEFPVTDVVVVESRLSPRGPSYLDLHREPLAGPAGGADPKLC